MKTEKDFADVYKMYAPRVHRLCLGYASGDDDLAKEWLQITFTKVWNHRKSFKGKSAVSTWIYRIAVNVCLSDLRKSKKYQELDENIVVTDLSNDDEDRQAKINKMYQCINKLSDQNKAMIMLELEDVPQADIAETIGIAYGATRTRLNRIRKVLLKCMTNG